MLLPAPEPANLHMRADPGTRLAKGFARAPCSQGGHARDVERRGKLLEMECDPQREESAPL